MSITAVILTDGIRVDRGTQKGSIYDVIQLVTQGDPRYSARVLARLNEHHPDLHPKWMKPKINGKGRDTLVADAATLVEVAWHCPGRTATEFKRKGAETVCRILGGDLTLVDEIQRRHSQVAGTAEEEFLLAGNQGNHNQVAFPELPYSLEQLQQMQAAATAIVASKEGIQQCSVVLQEFSMAKYTQYMQLRGQETQLKQKDVHLNKEQAGNRQPTLWLEAEGG
ncbi:TPA: hypothetical protein ACH3X1_012650 [Trebouxia sp. C0004]